MTTPAPSKNVAWVPSMDQKHIVCQTRLVDKVLCHGVEGGGRGIPIRCAAAWESLVVMFRGFFPKEHHEVFLKDIAGVVLSILPLYKA